MKKRSRFLSVLLALALVLGLAPAMAAPASAVDLGENTATEYVTGNGETGMAFTLTFGDERYESILSVENVSGSLPDGLELTYEGKVGRAQIEISGTPTKGGDYHSVWSARYRNYIGERTERTVLYDVTISILEVINTGTVYNADVTKVDLTVAPQRRARPPEPWR